MTLRQPNIKRMLKLDLSQAVIDSEGAPRRMDREHTSTGKHRGCGDIWVRATGELTG